MIEQMPTAMASKMQRQNEQADDLHRDSSPGSIRSPWLFQRCLMMNVTGRIAAVTIQRLYQALLHPPAHLAC